MSWGDGTVAISLDRPIEMVSGTVADSVLTVR